MRSSGSLLQDRSPAVRVRGTPHSDETGAITMSSPVLGSRRQASAYVRSGGDAEMGKEEESEQIRMASASDTDEKKPPVYHAWLGNCCEVVCQRFNASRHVCCISAERQTTQTLHLRIHIICMCLGLLVHDSSCAYFYLFNINHERRSQACDDLRNRGLLQDTVLQQKECVQRHLCKSYYII